jgi:hypothetical protein
MNHFALVFITKKNKKIEVILPLTAELQIMDMDSLNFTCYWDPRSWDQLGSGITVSQNGTLPPSATYKIRVVCNHALEKKSLLDRIQGVR